MDTCRTIREIRRDMHKQREWRNELEKMKIGNVVGSLSVESKTLRANLIPITQRTLEQVSPSMYHLCNCLPALTYCCSSHSEPSCSVILDVTRICKAQTMANEGHLAWCDRAALSLSSLVPSRHVHVVIHQPLCRSRQ